MPRRKLPRTISTQVSTTFFKPHGTCLKDLQVIELQRDELEAIKLHDFDQLSQTEAANSMNISQPTFGRILNTAYQKISTALFKGQAIVIKNQKGGVNENTQLQAYLNSPDTHCDVCHRYCLAD